MAWPIFLVTAAAILLAASVLSRSATAIAERTGISHVWIGAFLLAGATSLPELAIDSAAVVRDSPDLATGDLFGSNMANMAILAIVALMFGRARVLQRRAPGIALTASFALIMTGIAALFIVARIDASIAGTFGYGSVLLVVAAATGLLLLPDVREAVAETEQAQVAIAGQELPSLSRAIALFGASAIVIGAAAPFLAESAKDIAEITGLEETFVGVVGLALTTSLPELATSAAAVRLGALDLAVGNLYGSNAINMTILVWLDALYTDGPLLESVDATNAVAALIAMLLMLVGLTDLMLRAERRRFPLDPLAALILAGYVLGVLMVWSM